MDHNINQGTHQTYQSQPNTLSGPPADGHVYGYLHPPAPPPSSMNRGNFSPSNSAIWHQQPEQNIASVNGPYQPNPPQTNIQQSLQYKPPPPPSSRGSPRPQPNQWSGMQNQQTQDYPPRQVIPGQGSSYGPQTVNGFPPQPYLTQPQPPTVSQSPAHTFNQPPTPISSSTSTGISSSLDTSQPHSARSTPTHHLTSSPSAGSNLNNSQSQNQPTNRPPMMPVGPPMAQPHLPVSQIPQLSTGDSSVLQAHQTAQQSQIGPPPLAGQPYVPQKITGPPPITHLQYPPLTANPSIPSQPPPGMYPPQSDLNSQKSTYPPNPMAPPMQNLNSSMGRLDVNDPDRPINLLQEKRILPNRKPTESALRFETVNNSGCLIPPNRKNCSPEVMRCTLKAIPSTQNLLSKVKLPLGLIIHPFKDMNSLPVVTAGSIVRCKRCRTYINPFASFVDERRWRCNMCFATNDAPEEFMHHPVKKTYGEPHTRPECTNSTIEFVAPQEYMLRPPQPAVYLFLFDVSHSALETGYLQIACDALIENLDRLPGDSRTRIGFLSYDRNVHFYRLSEGAAQPQMIVVSDTDDVFIPTPENLLVNLREKKEMVQELLHQLPLTHSAHANDTYSSLGSALEVGKKLMAPYGGRITVFQQSMPCIGPGSLVSREDPNSRAGTKIDTATLNPATDYYKKLALDCSASQVAIDFFFLNSQYIDIATLSCASRFSAGDIHYYPGLHSVHNPAECERLARDLYRYFTRKIGFESVMRIRCTKGLAIHTFHGNFFVRSTDLLSLANTNPDSSYAVNLTIEDPLTDLTSVCFQAALLYTTSKGERRIRVHTLCFPVAKNTAEIFRNVDCGAVVALLAKMGVDRSVTASLTDARDAIMNAVIDPLKMFKETQSGLPGKNSVCVPRCLRLFPLYIHCLLKHPAFRTGVSTRLDDRVHAMVNFKIQPTAYLLQDIHPDLYRVDNLPEETETHGRQVSQPELLPLSAEYLTQSGSFLLDCGWRMYLLVGRMTSPDFIRDVLGAPQFSNIDDPMYTIERKENEASTRFHAFIDHLQDMRPHHAPVRVIRDDARERVLFFSHLMEDRTESSMSLHEFLLHISQKISP